LINGITLAENKFILLTLIIINSLLILLFTTMLSVKIVKNFEIARIIQEGISILDEKRVEKRINRELKKYRRNNAVKLNFIEKIDLYLLEKSNIKKYIPFINPHILIVTCVIIFVACFRVFYNSLHFIPSSVVLSLVVSLVPVFILDLMGKFNSEAVRKKLAQFISVLNRWCSVKEDIFYAFEKSVDSGIGEPLRTYIRDMVIQVNRGIDPLDAMTILQMKIDNPQFNDFVINIKQAMKHRGDLKKLLNNLEEQFYKIEEEFNRRKISTYTDRLIVYFIMFMVLFTGYFLLKANPENERFYLQTVHGKALIMAFSILYVFGFYLAAGIGRVKY